ncbi:hypothetical protein DL98DRAFT_178759 [Cadophora sp. DSE1049]|nr:hypothetical protein DL98DRAFT_178759 [Cadophora sp. DSE1049]
MALRGRWLAVARRREPRMGRLRGAYLFLFEGLGIEVCNILVYGIQIRQRWNHWMPFVDLSIRDLVYIYRQCISLDTYQKENRVDCDTTIDCTGM